MRFQKARQKALQELRDLYDLAAKDVGEANAAIFEMQQMILEDRRSSVRLQVLLLSIS